MDGRSLRAFEVFRDLGDELLDELAAEAEERTLHKGDVIFDVGDLPDALFVVREGLIKVSTARGNPGAVSVALGSGSTLGEVGVMERSVSVASAEALRETEVVRIPGETVRRLAREHRPFGVRMIELAMGGPARERDVFSTPELGQRSYPRVRVEREVTLRPVGDAVRLRVENLSLGGACFEKVPEDWAPGREVEFSLELEPGRELLRARAAVVWRKEERAGVRFLDESPDLRSAVREALTQLLA